MAACLVARFQYRPKTRMGNRGITMAMANMIRVKISSGGSRASSMEPIPRTAMMMRLNMTSFLSLILTWKVFFSRSEETIAEDTLRNALAVDRPTAEAPMKKPIIRNLARPGLKDSTYSFTMKGMISSVSEEVRVLFRARPIRPIIMVPVQTMACRAGVK